MMNELCAWKVKNSTDELDYLFWDIFVTIRTLKTRKKVLIHFFSVSLKLVKAFN